MSTDILKKIKATIAELEKRFGQGAIMPLSDEGSDQAIDVIPTGSLSLNEALGIGGYPRGRIIEIYGPESSGKTTLCLHAIAEAQRLGGVATFIDAEHAFDPVYARAIGVSTKDLLLSQPDSGEQALEIAEALTKSGIIDLIVVDSVAALTPQAEIDGEMSDLQVGLQARLMSKALRKLTHITAKTGTTLIFINQLRQKIGVMFGNPETTPGGNALKYYTSIRLDIRRIGQVKLSDEAIGARTRVKVVKNKCAPPFRKAEFDIRWGTGIDAVTDLLDQAIDLGVVDKKGAHLSFGGERIAQGRERAREALLTTDSLADAIRSAVATAKAPGGLTLPLPPPSAPPSGDYAADDYAAAVN